MILEKPFLRLKICGNMWLLIESGFIQREVINCEHMVLIKMDESCPTTLDYNCTVADGHREPGPESMFLSTNNHFKNVCPIRVKIPRG